MRSLSIRSLSPPWGSKHWARTHQQCGPGLPHPWEVLPERTSRKRRARNLQEDRPSGSVESRRATASRWTLCPGKSAGWSHQSVSPARPWAVGARKIRWGERRVSLRTQDRSSEQRGGSIRGEHEERRNRVGQSGQTRIDRAGAETVRTSGLAGWGRSSHWREAVCRRRSDPEPNAHTGTRKPPSLSTPGSVAFATRGCASGPGGISLFGGGSVAGAWPGSFWIADSGVLVRRPELRPLAGTKRGTARGERWWRGSRTAICEGHRTLVGASRARHGKSAWRALRKGALAVPWWSLGESTDGKNGWRVHSRPERICSERVRNTLEPRQSNTGGWWVAGSWFGRCSGSPSKRSDERWSRIFSSRCSAGRCQPFWWEQRGARGRSPNIACFAFKRTPWRSDFTGIGFFWRINGCSYDGDKRTSTWLRSTLCLRRGVQKYGTVRGGKSRVSGVDEQRLVLSRFGTDDGGLS